MNIQLELTEKQIQQLREIMDALPLNPWAPLVVAVNRALPTEFGQALRELEEV